VPIIGKLVEMYRTQGIDICTGLGSYEFDGLPSSAAPFTWFFKNDRNITSGLGIAMQEIYLLEHILSAYQPRNVLIIGNSQGWSTLATALLLPHSRVVAIDAGFDESSLQGLDLTNRMAALGGLDKLRAVKGVSPQDVAAIVDSTLDGRVDFAFIDGTHTNEQIVLDFQAVSMKAATDAVYLFHDVHSFNLYNGIARIEAVAGHAARTLAATPSGMALLYDPVQHPELREAVAAFAPTPELRALAKRAAQQLGYHRPKAQLPLSFIFMQGMNVVCRLAGVKPRPRPRGPG
jgi:predicted O-methyltransferase YrrM